MKLAVGDLKTIGASFSHMLSSTMISRLVLNLRSVSNSTIDVPFDGPMATTSMKFMARAIGNLGEELETILDGVPAHHNNTGSEVILLEHVRLPPCNKV
jgi:hypothetical protein